MRILYSMVGQSLTMNGSAAGECNLNRKLRK
jgi:hypothetical protein